MRTILAAFRVELHSFCYISDNPLSGSARGCISATFVSPKVLRFFSRLQYWHDAGGYKLLEFNDALWLRAVRANGTYRNCCICSDKRACGSCQKNHNIYPVNPVPQPVRDFLREKVFWSCGGETFFTLHWQPFWMYWCGESDYLSNFFSDLKTFGSRYCSQQAVSLSEESYAK